MTGSRHRVPWPNMRRHKGITKTGKFFLFGVIVEEQLFFCQILRMTTFSIYHIVGSRYDERQRWPAAMPGRADWVERQNHYYPEIMPKVNNAKSEKMKRELALCQ